MIARAAGAGYVASEQVRGTLDGRQGSFVIHHVGMSDAGGGQRTFGHVVPESATGELEGLCGEVEIRIEPRRGHTLTLDYALT